MRSLLLVPAGSPAALDAAVASGADALILDLAGAAEGPDAGRAALETLQTAAARGGRPRLLVRINGLGSGLLDRDLRAVMAGAPDGIVLPGAAGGRDVQCLGARLAVAEAEHGLADGTTGILAALGVGDVFALGTLAGASPRLLGVAWAGEGVAADAGAGRDATGHLNDPARLARALARLAAASAGVAAVDAASPHRPDLDGLAEACEQARRDGFTAKMALHPAQVPAINAAFAPGEA